MKFDIIVIGAGPGGYVCALKAAQLGLKVALVEKGELGGTCLNVGCIPSKALLHSTEIFCATREEAAANGVKIAGEVTLDVPTMVQRKEAVSAQLRKGIEMLLKRRQVTVIKGTARLNSPTLVTVTAADGSSSVIEGANIVLATGSKSAAVPALPVDGRHVITSDEALCFDKAPASLLVVGAGAIGLELGSVWARAGSRVTVVEFLPQIAPAYDADVVRQAERAFKKQGMEIHTGTAVTGVAIKDGLCVVTVKKADLVLSFTVEKVLVAVGRVPNNENLGLEELGIRFSDPRRRIVETDAELRTNIPNIFAVGDIAKGPMLAHKAEEEGVAVAETIAGKKGHVDYDLIPGVIYTEPELASIGLSEKQCQERGLEVKVGKFNFAANGRALASGIQEGLAKVIACAKTDRILGVQIVGHGASELISTAAGHMAYSGSAEDLARTCFAHPTLAETLKEAAMAVDKAGIHSV